MDGGIKALRAAEISAVMSGLDAAWPPKSFDLDLATFVTQWAGDAYRLGIPVPQPIEIWIKSLEIDQVLEILEELGSLFNSFSMTPIPREGKSCELDSFADAVKGCDLIMSSLITLGLLDKCVAFLPEVFELHGGLIGDVHDLEDKFVKVAGTKLYGLMLGDRQAFRG